ncbi:MAG TPA: DNA-binding protein [Sphingobium sp.]|uniref:helix-turn-helix domain-containing protein n=1 Tax=Sphingobium sp. TaxID=1912891 RepID=UPI002ED01430
MTISGPLARAARILVQWPRDHVARLANVDEASLAAFETGGGHLIADALTRLQHALEDGGAVFLPEDSDGGAGVRLKFTTRDVRALNRLEDEGGTIGSDDV